MMRRQDETIQIRSLSDDARPEERAIDEVEGLPGFAIQDPFDRLVTLRLCESGHVLESKLYLARRQNPLFVAFLVETCTQRSMPSHHLVERVLHRGDRQRPSKMQHEALIESAARLGPHLRLDPHLALLWCEGERNIRRLGERIEIDRYKIRPFDFRHQHHSED